MAKSDFLSWDDDINDIELNHILGSFSESEMYFESSDEEFVPKTSKPETEHCAKPTYICPECNKVLKTISGFRGHVSKQHGKHTLKAHEHKYKSKANINVTTADLAQLNQDCNNMLDSFDKAFTNTSRCVQEDPMYNLFGESDTVKIAKKVQDSIQIKDFFHQLFTDIFQINSSICLSHEREMLFSRFHQLRLSETVEKGYSDHFSGNGFPECESKHFIQVFMLELINQLLTLQVQNQLKQSEQNQSDLSDNDQNTLFYISGYIIRSCSKRYSKVKDGQSSNKMNCVDCLISKSNHSTFVTKYSMWTKQKDRGGLTTPCDNFYLLVRELEMVIRKNVDISTLNATSMLCDKLKEIIMESFMVKYYCSKLFDGIEEQLQLCVLEDIIKLFLTIRGYAVTRVQRNIAMRDKGTVKKNSSSLRQALKEKNMNI